MTHEEQQMLLETGALLRELREQHGLSAQEVADKLGWKSDAHLLRIERGEVEPMILTVDDIARVYDWTLETVTAEVLRRMKEKE